MKNALLMLLFAVAWVGLGPVARGETTTPGHAEVELLRGSDGYQPGGVIGMGLRFRLDDGWHTYWVNPGEGGIPVEVEWTLPDGWVAGPLLHPVPMRFSTGELPSFGYQGEVVMPVFLTAGHDAAGEEVVVTAEVSWLACDDSACVPGDRTVSATLIRGKAGPGDGAAAITRSLVAVPAPVAGAALRVIAGDGVLQLELSLPDDLDPSESEVFPMTPEVVDAASRPRFEKVGGVWRARAEISEYADGAPSGLELVIAGGKLAKPLLVSWDGDSRE